MSFTIYPAIDLRGGRVVRLKEGDPARLTAYSDDPVETALCWLDAGATWLHVVNLDAAFGEVDSPNIFSLKEICRLGARVQHGGGLRSLATIQRVIALGVSRVVLGTLAIDDPGLVAEVVDKFGVEKVALGIDARDGVVRVRGWKESSAISATDLALRMRTLGLRTVIFTDVSRDGLGTGLNIPASRQLAETTGLNVIASGGVHTLEDVLAARDAGLAGVIIGRALYEGTINLKEALESKVS